jgi:hypothetical protein
VFYTYGPSQCLILLTHSNGYPLRPCQEPYRIRVSIMLPRILLLSFYAALPVFALFIDHHAHNGSTMLPNITIDMCGTSPPSEELRAAHSYFRGSPIARLTGGSTATKPLVVEIYMHFVSTADQAPLFNSRTRSTLISNQVNHVPFPPRSPILHHQSLTPCLLPLPPRWPL